MRHKPHTSAMAEPPLATPEQKIEVQQKQQEKRWQLRQQEILPDVSRQKKTGPLRYMSETTLKNKEPNPPTAISSTPRPNLRRQAAISWRQVGEQQTNQMQNCNTSKSKNNMLSLLNGLPCFIYHCRFVYRGLLQRDPQHLFQKQLRNGPSHPRYLRLGGCWIGAAVAREALQGVPLQLLEGRGVRGRLGESWSTTDQLCVQ